MIQKRTEFKGTPKHQPFIKEVFGNNLHKSSTSFSESFLYFIQKVGCFYVKASFPLDILIMIFEIYEKSIDMSI